MRSALAALVLLLLSPSLFSADCHAFNGPQRIVPCTDLHYAAPDSHVAQVLVTSAVILGSAWDAESTLSARRKHPDGYEANPIMRFALKGGPAGLYGAQVLIDYSLLRAAFIARRRGSRTWWIAPVLSAGVHALAAQHNRTQ